MSNSEKEKEEESSEREYIQKIIRYSTKGILFITLIVLILILVNAFLVPNSYGITQDVNYTFYRNEFHNNTAPFTYTYNNFGNNSIFTTHYNATFSFEDDEDGALDASHDFYSAFNNGITEIIDNHTSHDKVIHMEDTGAGALGDAEILDDFTGQTSGTIEFWLMCENVNDYIDLMLEDGRAVFGVHLNIVNGLLRYYYLGFNDITSGLISNKWYHFRIDFECSGGGYMGLPADDFFVYLDGVRYGNYNFRDARAQISTLRVNEYNNPSGSEWWLDAFGYSWDTDYFIGLNIVPYNYEGESIEIDKFGFAYNSDGSLIDTGSDDVEGWSDVEAVGDYVNIEAAGSDSRSYQINHNLHNGEYGIEREFNEGTGIIEIIIDTYYMGFDSDTGYFNFSIYSSDDTLIIQLHFLDTGSGANALKLYWRDSDAGLVLISEDFSWDGVYGYIQYTEWYLHYDNIGDLACLYVNGSYWDCFPLINPAKTGLGKIELIGNANSGSDYQIEWIDNVGVYFEGNSSAEAFGVAEFTSGLSENWYLDRDYYININASGSFAFVVEDLYTDYSTIHSYRDYGINYSVFLVNFYIEDGTLYPTINFACVTNTTFDLSSVYIHGIQLREGTNIYYMEYDDFNVNNSTSYFDAIDDRLYFRIDFDSSEMEYIQATFDINNQFCINASLCYTSHYEGYSEPYFIMDYSDDSISYYPFSLYSERFRYILPQERVIDKFVVNVSDYIPELFNYSNQASGYVSGYLRSISLDYTRDIELSIIVVALTDMIIPIILIIIPSLGVVSMFRKYDIGAGALIPMMILMTIICWASELIPAWVFVMLLFIYGGLLVLGRDKRGGF